MKVIEHSVAQLLVLAEVASAEVDRPNIAQVRWMPHYVAATNGHRLVLAMLPHDKDRNVGVSADALRRWLTGQRASDTFQLALEQTQPGRGERVYQRMVLQPAIAGRTDEKLLLPVSTWDFPPVEGVFPAGTFVNGRPVMPVPERRVIGPHAISPRYLEGLGKIASAFHFDQTGIELLGAPSALDPILYGAHQHALHDGDGAEEAVYYLVMPMRPPWAETRGASRAVQK